jgi:elongation factor Ts
MDAAIKVLREKGLASISKKADRSTYEGKIFIANTNDKAVILEVNCETDFVAGNASFDKFGSSLASAILNAEIDSIDQLDQLSLGEASYKEALSEALLALGENITVKRFSRSSAHQIAGYVHMNAKIGVLVSFSGSVDQELAKGIAMQVAAANPSYLSSSQVPQEEIEKEKEINRVQAKNEGRPDDVIEKIVMGRVSKYYKEVCLLEQPYVKDDKKSIKELLPKDVSILNFIRYALV